MGSEKEIFSQTIKRTQYRNTFRKIFRLYMQSNQWKNVVFRVKERDKNMCQDCEKRGTVVHHTDYEDWGLGNYEEVESCLLLCAKCHINRHRGSDGVYTPFWAHRGGWGDEYGIYEVDDITQMLKSKGLL